MLRLRFESPRTRLRRGFGGLALLALAATGCRQDAPTDRVRVSGHVEADDVQLAAEVGGRLLELTIAEGDRVTAGQVIAQARHAGCRADHRTLARGPCPGRRAAAAPAGRLAARRHPAGRGAGHRRRGRHRRPPSPSCSTRRPISTGTRRCSRPTRARARHATTRRRGAMWRATGSRRPASARARRPRARAG